jgi:hypothetical protein
VKSAVVKGNAHFTGACPVKFMPMRSEAHFTGIAPADGTGVKFFAEKEHGVFNRGTLI